jgi:NAD(P)H-dependent FMN reductase
LVSWALGQLIHNFQFDASGILHLLQTTESAINELIFLGLALFFLVNLEARLKRSIALRALHRLRSIAHVVDMHQLTKDPAFLLSGSKISETQHSPQRDLTRNQLKRYLDYCSELLALDAKVAALFAQNTDDKEILNAVSDLEQLVQGLSAKIWQKIMILDLSSE